MAGASADVESGRVAREFLTAYAPFDRFSSRLRQYLVDHCDLQRFTAGEVILDPGAGQVDRFHLIVRGRVDAERPGVGEAGVERFELEAGENFPMAALLGQRAGAYDLHVLRSERELRVRVVVNSVLVLQRPRGASERCPTPNAPVSMPAFRGRTHGQPTRAIANAGTFGGSPCQQADHFRICRRNECVATHLKASTCEAPCARRSTEQFR